MKQLREDVPQKAHTVDGKEITFTLSELVEKWTCENCGAIYETDLRVCERCGRE